eukprot:gene3348-4197_t
MSYNVVSTVQKPTGVTHSLTGNFTSPTDKNLIISKCTKIEIFLMTQEGLQPMFDINIYGRIATLKLFRVAGEKQDFLFISTERYRFCVLAFDQDKREVVTKASGNAEDTIGRPTETGQIGITDPDGRLIALHLYEGLLKLIPIDKGPSPIQRDAFNLRLEELQVIDIAFLYGCNVPTIAVLFKDTRDARHVNTYELLVKEKELVEGPWSKPNVDDAASILIPVPMGGVLVVGEQVISYLNGSLPKQITIPHTKIVTFEKVDKDGSRYLMGDHLGYLYVLLLINEDGKVSDLKWVKLGETSISSSISYLDSGVVYIGSSSGDSQLIRLNSEKDTTTDSYISILENYTNLGPIIDFCVVDIEKQGQGQIVTCSGSYKDGTLRIIRNGIGIAEQASIELQGIKGLWPLRDVSGQSKFDRYLVVSFIGSTKVLSFSGEDIEETDIPGFDVDSPTIYCGATEDHHQYIQISTSGIYLIDGSNLVVSDCWKPPKGVISLCSRYKNQIIISIGKQLLYFTIQAKKLVLSGNIELPYEISCMDISSFGNKPVSEVCAIGLWTDISVRLIKLPDLVEVYKETLGGEILPRSVLMITFEGIDYLFCSLGDGHLFNFTVDQNFQLHERKKLSLGTQPIILTKFQLGKTVNVFASSDRPTVIYSNNRKLFYSVINLKEVNHICSFNSDSFQDSIALSSENSLIIGNIDNIQKLHIRTVPLQREMARRICHVEDHSCYCILTIKVKENPSFTDAPDNEVNYIKILNDQTFEVSNQYKLNDYEYGWCLTPIKFKNDKNTYLVVGTAYCSPLDEKSQGRILIFSIVDGRLILVDEHAFKGSVYDVMAFNGKLLAAVNKRLHLITWNPNGEQSGKILSSECVFKGHTLIIKLSTRGGFIVVADMMKSVSLLSEKPDESIQEIGRNPQPLWLTTVSMIDDDTYLGAEASYNLVVIKKNSDSANDQERELLDSVGHFHVGESINKFVHGSLVTLPESDNQTRIPTILFGTIGGSIGVVATISKQDFEFFSALQSGLNKVIKGVGGFTHESWRSFSNEHHTIDAHNFIDGDLIETFLDLNHDKMLKVVKDMNISIEDAYKRIESLMQHIR